MAKSVLDLVKENVSDTAAINEISKVMLRYAKRSAIIQGVFLIIAVIASVFAFVQWEKYQGAIKLSEEYKIKNEESNKVAAEQRAISEITQVRLHECEMSKK